MVDVMTAGIPWLASVNTALLMLGSPGAVLAGQSGSIPATGSVSEVISVEVPPPQTSLPPRSRVLALPCRCCCPSR